MRKLTISLLLGLVAATLLVPAGRQDPVAASTADESAFVALVNQARAAAGVPPLIVHAELTSLARAWSQHQADAGQISHSQPISAGLSAPWQKLGENVGVGPDVQSIMAAFMASGGHYANIVDPEFTHIGVGVVWSGPALYTTHRFMRLAAPPPTTAPPPTAPPPTAPPPTAPPPTAPPPTAPPPTAPPPTAPPTTTAPPPQATAPPATLERVTAVLTALRAATS